MKKIADALEKSLKILIVVGLSAMTIIIILGIFARYILLTSIPWTEELARYLMIWTGFIAFGLAYRKRELIAVKLFIGILPPDLLKIAIFIADLLCAIFLMIVIFYGTKLCIINLYQVSPAARIPMSAVYAAIPVGCLIYLVFVAESCSNFFTKIGSE